MTFHIEPFQADQVDEILAISQRAWTPVFALLQEHVQRYIYDAFYPKGWWQRQQADIQDMIAEGKTSVWIARSEEKTVGYIGIRIHPEDMMGEIYIIAVDPDHQGRGAASMLMRFAFDEIKRAGMKMVMVETGGDPGHAPARRAYEAIGFERWPVARYFKQLT